MRLLVFACALVWVGCLAPGERASTCDQTLAGCQNGTTCLPGETCSSLTPNGLHFGGARLGDDESLFGGGGPLVTARGGTQTILISGLDGYRFDALVDGDAFTVRPIDAEDVAITGVAAGSARLRLVEPGTQLLYDRIELQVAEVASTSIGPTSWLDTQPTQVLWGASDQTAVIAMRDADGTRLADETMTITPGAGSIDGAQWDVFHYPAPLPNPLVVGFATTDGTPRSASVDVVTTADHLEYLPFLDPQAPSSIPVGGDAEYPLRASLGGRAIGGAQLTLAVDGPIALAAAQLAHNIPTVSGTAAGNGDLYVSIGTAQLTFPLAVVPAGKRAHRDTRASAPELAAGDRAALAR